MSVSEEFNAVEQLVGRLRQTVETLEEQTSSASAAE
jgi:hypothetical protein